MGDVVVSDGDWIIHGRRHRPGHPRQGRRWCPPQSTRTSTPCCGWADEIRRLRVRTNADTPEDAHTARGFGAEGIGLCRTEHMFMQQDRLPHVQNMIMAETTEERETAPRQAAALPARRLRGHLRGHGRAAGDHPPARPAAARVPAQLHRRHGGAGAAALTDAPAGEIAKQEVLAAKVKSLSEANPMLGTRGCRLGIQWPEIYAMQVRAIIEAAADVLASSGEMPHVEIMIPLVGFEEELKRMRTLTMETADAVLKEREVNIDYTIGTMIEVPRAALTADQIAQQADFFSFGTNDLTQMTLGFSRDDAEGKFLTHYLKTDLLRTNPFEKLDQAGVGQLIAMAVQKGRSVKPELKTGICGEHGGEPSSVKFCHRTGLNYVSCSPYRVPLARLAAAQAVLEEQDGRQGGRLRRATRAGATGARCRGSTHPCRLT